MFLRVLLGAGLGWLLLGRGGEEAGPPAPARVVAPQPGADELEAAGLRLKGEGRHAEAIDKLTAALAQDPARTALHYQVAACQARLGRPDGASQALAAYLGGGADPDALGRRLAEDPDFGRVLREEAFSSWLADRGVRVAPAAPAGEAKEAGDEGRDRPRKAAKAREGERKGKKARKAKGKGRKAGPAPKPAPRPAPKPEFEMPTF